jgi:hypothetical protein
MNKEDMIKYAMMAVGAYLVWQWLTQEGGFLDPAKSAAKQVTGEDGKTPAEVETQQQMVARLGKYFYEQVKPIAGNYYTEAQSVEAVAGALREYKATYGNADGFEAYAKTMIDARVAQEKQYAAQPKYAVPVDYPAGVVNPPTATPTPTEEAIKAAAYDASKAGTTGSYKLNGHEWNWYRMSRAIELGTYDAAKHQPALDAYGDPNLQYTASEYHALLSKAGLGSTAIGWGAPAGMGGGNAWRN